MPRRCRGIRGDVGVAPYAPPTEIPCVTFGRTEPSAPTHAYRTRTLSLSCHSEPVTDVTGVGIRPPCLPLRGGPVLTLGCAAKRS